MEKDTWERVPNFDPAEFDSPDKPGSGLDMQKHFIFKLQSAREQANISFKINSGFRTAEHNTKIGGARTSAHLGGWAADIATATSRDRYLILNALVKAGFTRLGIGANFIHVDNDPNLPDLVAWDYYDH